MTDEIKIPKVRMAKPQGRPIQLRYTDQVTKKEIRITTGTHDAIEALEHKRKLEAKLLLGLQAKPRKRQGGPTMSWEDFRQRYYNVHLSTLRRKSRESAESRLDIAERILRPRTLVDVADSEALHNLQARLLAGDEGARGPRSPHTARNYMVTVMAALSWAQYMGWLTAVPKLKKLKVAKLRQMKGRPISGEEFDRMLDKVESNVGPEAADSWKYVLRGAWESGLRLGELMHMHWADERYIVPHWQRGALPFLAIPAAMQKNATEESIPLLPGFESLLLETPDPQRFGWVFNPISLHTKLKRPVRGSGRATAAWVGEVISRIGEAAGIVVHRYTDGRIKYASAHDLRRSCAERIASAGVPEREVSRVLRHASVETTRKHYAPGTVQESAGIIRAKLLPVPRYSEVAELT